MVMGGYGWLWGGHKWLQVVSSGYRVVTVVFGRF